MPEYLVIDVKDHIVQVTVSGAFKLQNAKTFFLEILKRAQEENLYKILIDTRGISSNVSTVDRFEIAVHMAEQQAFPMKIAFIATEEMVKPEAFMEIAAVNRGVNTKVHTDKQEALNWLAE